MLIRENIPLQPFNSFGIESNARYFAEFRDGEELEEIISSKTARRAGKLILGGGSNILLRNDFKGIVLKNAVSGITEVHEDPGYIYVKAGAGENWHRFVLYCINMHWAGLENLSLIPGNVGASPMQNIGAYGVELDEVFWSLEAYHLKEHKLVTFTSNDCGFGYRDSVFKSKYRDQFAIMNVTFRLYKHPRFNTSYGAVEQELQRMGVEELNIKAISDAVINIRQSKLPDPALIGNAGSFFKNPIIPKERYEQLQAKFTDMPGYEQANGTVKIPAAWLIEQTGPAKGVSWKGYRKNDAGVHERHALVLVNYGSAKGKEIYELSEKILQSVKDKFGVILEREVNIIG